VVEAHGDQLAQPFAVEGEESLASSGIATLGALEEVLRFGIVGVHGASR
jgi:hypothetical protein